MHFTAVCSREPDRGHWAAYTNYVDNIVYRALLRTAATSVRTSQYLPFTVFLQIGYLLDQTDPRKTTAPLLEARSVSKL